MCRSLAFCVLLLASMAAQSANDTTCPTLSVANTQLQQRAEELLNLMGAGARAEAGTPDFWMSLANVIVARAREEARLWLVQKIANEVCAPNKTSRAYFPNTCETVNGIAPYPGTSLNVLRTRLQRDVFALPACYGYRRLSSASSLEAVDAYLLEALLVAVYLHWKKDATPEPSAPSLDPLPDKETIATLLVGAVAMRLPTGPAATGTCMRPDITTLGEAVSTLLKHLDGTDGRFASPDSVFSALLGYLNKWCPDQARTLQAASETYMMAVRGEYLEAALTAAGSFLCAQGENLEICSRLPLIAEVAAAKTSEDMEAALDRAIAPVGAWRRKQTEQAWSLNAMAGIGGGVERLSDDGGNGEHFTSGLYLPIAIEYSRPAHKGWIGAYAIGLTALDLGGLVSYSEREEVPGGETSSSANSSWSSLTAPGAYVAIALRDSPFRVGISLSRTPELRSVDFDDGTERDVDSTRLLLFVTVDVTLLSF
jgi:hypothetical protein